MCFNVPFLAVRDSLIAGKSGRSCQNDDHRSSSGVSNHPDVSASCAGLSGRLHSSVYPLPGFIFMPVS